MLSHARTRALCSRTMLTPSRILGAARPLPEMSSKGTHCVTNHTLPFSAGIDGVEHEVHEHLLHFVAVARELGQAGPKPVWRVTPRSAP